MNNTDKRNLQLGLLFISPCVIGFLAFALYPLGSTLYFSLWRYSVSSPAVFVGATNYKDLFTDAIFWKSVYNTFFFAIFAIPLGLLVSLTLAILLNFNLPGKAIFRTIFFLPSLVPVVCLAVLWQWMLNGQFALVNSVLRPVLDLLNSILGTHLVPPNWLQEPTYARWGIIFTALWSVGQAVVIYLAGLQNVPRHLYESAEIDGANFWQKTRHITLPIIAPVIYFNVIVGLIGAFQVFAVPYVMASAGDGPDRSLLFIATYLYENAFNHRDIGYACTIGLVLFLIVLALTYAASRLAERHIYYAGK